MPFTASHAVVALPFIRTALPYGAVAVGAMAPDLPLFFPAPLSYSLTHGFPSLLFITIPLGAILYAVWRILLRPAAAVFLPTFVGARLPASWTRAIRPGASEVLLAVCAVAIGVLSHVVWDEFTHPGRLGSVLLPVLAHEWGPLPGTQWLQYLSSVGGLAVIAITAVHYLRHTPPVPAPSAPRLRRTFWGSLIAAMVIGVVLAIITDGLPASVRDLAEFSFSAGTLAGATMLVATVVAAIALAMTRRRRAQ